MSEQETAGTDNPAGVAPDAVDTDTAAKIAALESSIQKLEQNNQLLKEEKQRKAAEAEEARQEAVKAAKDKAEKDNDFKQLYESSQADAESAKTQLKTLQDEIAHGKLKTEAAKIAGQLTTDSVKAGLLAEKIEARLQDVDGSFKVTDGAGNLTVSSYDDLKTELSGTYAFLVDASGASGAGASGGSQTPPPKSGVDAWYN